MPLSSSSRKVYCCSEYDDISLSLCDLLALCKLLVSCRKHFWIESPRLCYQLRHRSATIYNCWYEGGTLSRMPARHSRSWQRFFKNIFSFASVPKRWCEKRKQLFIYSLHCSQAVCSAQDVHSLRCRPQRSHTDLEIKWKSKNVPISTTYRMLCVCVVNCPIKCQADIEGR